MNQDLISSAVPSKRSEHPDSPDESESAASYLVRKPQPWRLSVQPLWEEIKITLPTLDELSGPLGLSTSHSTDPTASSSSPPSWLRNWTCTSAASLAAARSDAEGSTDAGPSELAGAASVSLSKSGSCFKPTVGELSTMGSRGSESCSGVSKVSGLFSGISPSRLSASWSKTGWLSAVSSAGSGEGCWSSWSICSAVTCPSYSFFFFFFNPNQVKKQQCVETRSILLKRNFTWGAEGCPSLTWILHRSCRLLKVNQILLRSLDGDVRPAGSELSTGCSFWSYTGRVTNLSNTQKENKYGW